MSDDAPDFRATLRRGAGLRLVEWGPWLAAGGPLHTLLDERSRAGVGIADLTVVRGNDELALELIVEFRTGDRATHRDTLRAWAARVGYKRVWFSGELVELEPSPGGPAETRCTGCRVRLVDSDASFWEFVRHHGAFPATCALCGSDLPQWTPVRQTEPAVTGSHTEATPRSTACR